MKPLKSIVSAFLCAVLPATPLWAATKYWDINGATAGASAGATAAGTWDTAAVNWTTDSTGASATTTWAANDDAIFSAGANASGSFTVTISGTQSAASLTVEEGTILHGTGTLSFGAVNGVIDVASGATWNCSGAGSGLIAGTGGITKNNAGVLFLGGTESYSAAAGTAFLTINGGTVDFTGDTALGTVPGAANANAVTINGGTLRFSGTTALTLNVNRGVTIGASGGTIEVTSAASTGLSLPSAASFTLNGSGLMTKTGVGRFTMNTTSSSFTGKYKVLAGSISVPGDGRFGAVPGSPVADYFILDGATSGLRNSLTSPVTFDSKRGITLGAGGGSLIQPTTGPLTYSGIIAGTSGGALRILNNDGNGTFTGGIVILGGANTYDGPTTIAASTTLRLGASGVIPDGSAVTVTGTFDLNGNSETIKTVSGAGAITLGAGSLILDNPAGESSSATISGAAGSLTKNGSGTITFTGAANTGTFGTTVNNGTLIVNKSSSGNTFAMGDVTISGGSLAFAASGTTGDWILNTATITMNGGSWDMGQRGETVKKVVLAGGTILGGSGGMSTRNLTVTDTAPGFDIQSGTIGNGTDRINLAETTAGTSIIKSTVGTTTLNCQLSAVTGPLTISAGSLIFAPTVSHTLGVSSISINGTSLAISPISGATVTYANGSITGAGSLTKSGAGTLTLNGASPSYAQGITFSGGRLVIGNAGALGTGTLTVNSGALAISAGSALGTVTVNNAISLNTGAAPILSPAAGTPSTILELAGSISGDGALIRGRQAGTGAGTGLLSGPNTFTGGVLLGTDALQLGHSLAVGTGTFKIGDPVGGASDGGPAPTLSATTTLAGPNAITNAVTIATNFTVSGASQLELSGPTTLVNLSPTITVSSTADFLLSGPISGAGFGLTKAGTGALVLGGADTYDGITTVSAGTLRVNGSLANSAVSVNSGGTLGGSGTIAGTVNVNSGGTLAPGASIGTLTVVSAPTLGGTTAMEINKSGVVSSSDKLVLSSGTLTYGGTLAVTVAGGSDPLTGGESFDLFDASAFGGAFGLTNLPPLGPNLNWWTDRLMSDGSIYVNSAPTAVDKTYTRGSALSVKIAKADLLVGANDPNTADGDSVSYDSLPNTGSQGATVTQDSDFIYYVPANNNSDTLQYRLTDARGGAVTKNIQINVAPSEGLGQDVTVSGSSATVRFAGIPGFSYEVQRSTDLANWVLLGTTNIPPLGLVEWTDNFSDLGSPPPSAYYRLRQP